MHLHIVICVCVYIRLQAGIKAFDIHMNIDTSRHDTTRTKDPKEGNIHARLPFCFVFVILDTNDQYGTTVTTTAVQ